MSPRLKEFLTAWLAGLPVGLVTLAFRYADVGPALHILGCAGWVGLFSITLLAPNMLILLAAVVALPLAWHFGPASSLASYLVFQISAAYLGWVVFEMARHQYRLSSDPEYRERFEEHRRSR